MAGAQVLSFLELLGPLVTPFSFLRGPQTLPYLLRARAMTAAPCRTHVSWPILSAIRGVLSSHQGVKSAFFLTWKRVPREEPMGAPVCAADCALRRTLAPGGRTSHWAVASSGRVIHLSSPPSNASLFASAAVPGLTRRGAHTRGTN